MRARLALSLLFLAGAFGCQANDASMNGSENALSQDLDAALLLAPSSVTLTPGTAATISLQVDDEVARDGWTLGVSGMPAGLNVSANTMELDTQTPQTLTVRAGPSMAVGVYSVEVSATRGSTQLHAVLKVTLGHDSGAVHDAGGSPPSPDAGSVGGGAGGGSGTGSSSGSGVDTSGGSVPLLHFALSGDTRPPSCGATGSYPTAIINAIGSAEKARGAQFAIDLGDHMYVCDNDLSVATAQMNLFQQGVAHFGGTWFMTMGNHECYHQPCLVGSTNANYVAFMNALAPVSTSPYYAKDVQTSQGLATFVFIADSSWDSAQASWLQQTLSYADAHAAYTIVARHHPEGDTSIATNADSMAIIRQHKFSLFLSGHSHLYHHGITDNGRDLVMGNGGAPLISGGTFNGYGMVDQLPTGRLQVSVYDLNGDSLVDRWSVAPN